MVRPPELLAYICDNQPHLLAAALQSWMEASPRFTAFVETYRDKIRKKLRLTREPERILDLRSELETAWCLLNDRRIQVAYEPYASEKRRGPDFAVAYRVNRVFNVEVARIRVDTGEDGGINVGRGEERLLRSLLDKLGQMQPGTPNLLAIQTRAELARTIDLSRLMQGVKLRVEANDPAIFAASRSPGRYRGPADFYKDFLHLNGIVLWAPVTPLSGLQNEVQPQTASPDSPPPAAAWLNKPARPALDEKILRRVRELLV